MDKMKQKIKDFILELFFPSFCLGCQKEGLLLCDDCKSILEISEYNYCLCNKNPLRLPSEAKSKNPFGIAEGKCYRCQDKKLSGLFFALPYKEKFLTKKLIYQFKYPPYIKNLAKPLANILAEHLIMAGKNTEQIWENGILVPIPMEIRKMKNRGYNQTRELAKELGHIINVPVICDNLIKIKKTAPQMELSAKEREGNLKDAFSVKNPAEFSGKKIFLVDDVYTTGSTMEECARVLRDAGAKHVWGIAIAREG